MNGAAKAPYITTANWNIGGARVLQLRSREADKRAPGVEAPPEREAPQYVREKLNGALAEVLRQETLPRQTLTSGVLVHATKGLVDAVGGFAWTARFVPGAGGGYVRALAEPAAIATLRERWKSILGKTRDGRIINAELDIRGVI